MDEKYLFHWWISEKAITDLVSENLTNSDLESKWKIFFGANILYNSTISNIERKVFSGWNS